MNGPLSRDHIATPRKGFGKSDRSGVFARQSGLCDRCSAKLTGRWDIDHVIPLALGGPHSEDNWRGLCRPCHIEKTADDVRRIRKADRQGAKCAGQRKPSKRPLRGSPGPWPKGRKLQSRGFQKRERTDVR